MCIITQSHLEKRNIIFYLQIEIGKDLQNQQDEPVFGEIYERYEQH